MNSNELVSVIIVNKNYDKYLKQSIESVLGQTYSPIEIIVVDDFSSDDSWSIVQSYGDKISSVKTIGVGVAAARNLGILQASGRYIAFLDSDDFWVESKIKLQLQILKETGVGAVYCGIRLYYEQIKKLGDELRPTYRGNCSYWFRRFPARAIILLASSSLLLDRQLLKKTQLFNEKLSVSADWDFARRLCDRVNIEYIDEPLVNYRIHGENMSKSHIRTYRDWIYSASIMAFEDLRKGNFYLPILTMFGTFVILLKSVTNKSLLFFTRSKEANSY